MSFIDLKPVRFDYDDTEQAAPPQPYFAPYSNEHDLYQRQQHQHPVNNVGGHHHHPHHHHHQHQHHHHHPPPQQHHQPTYIIHQPRHQTAPHPQPHIQHPSFVVDDSDSQDSMDSYMTRMPNQAALVRFTTPKSKIESRYSNDSDGDDLNDDVINHWMPMTWIERSSDDPQVFNFVCLWGQCVAQSASKSEFEDHLFSHIPSMEESIDNGFYSTEESIACQVRGCGKHLASIFELNRHVSMHVFQADCQQKGSEALIEKEEYIAIESCGFEPSTNIEYEGMVLTCQWEDCGMQLHSLTDLFDHVGTHVDQVGDLDRVEQDFHNGTKKNAFPCRWTGCHHLADSRSNLRRHARHHSGEKALACPFCARFFSRRDKLYDHCVRRTILMTDPDIEDPYVCKQCQKRFGTERALCMHVTRHLVGHTCPLCSLALGSRSEIHRHLMTKHSRRTKDFKCSTCAKMFFTESEMNRHAVYHTDVMYSCKHCSEKFKWKKQLLKHMKEHDENFNPSPYTCHICDRTYTTGFALGRHLTRQHGLQIPYGFSRFTYKKCADGMMRLQTKKLFRGESGEAPITSAIAPY